MPYLKHTSPEQKQMEARPVLELLLRKAEFCQGAVPFAPGTQGPRATEGPIAQAVFADESRDQEAIPQEQSSPMENMPEAPPGRAKGISAGVED